jgi:hypothetical protein
VHRHHDPGAGHALNGDAPDDIAASLARRPLPLPDNVSATYWEAAARGDVLYQ